MTQALARRSLLLEISDIFMGCAKEHATKDELLVKTTCTPSKNMHNRPYTTARMARRQMCFRSYCDTDPALQNEFIGVNLGVCRRSVSRLGLSRG